jgi:hypothetical protein
LLGFPDQIAKISTTENKTINLEVWWLLSKGFSWQQTTCLIQTGPWPLTLFKNCFRCYMYLYTKFDHYQQSKGSHSVSNKLTDRTGVDKLNFQVLISLDR